MVLAELHGRAAAHRIATTLDAGLQRDVQGIIRTQRPTLDRHRARNVAVVVLEERYGRVARLGRIGRLLRRRAWRHDQRPARATAAGVGAEAVYVCAGVRGRLEPGTVAGRCALAFSDRGAGRRLQPAELRRAISRAAARAPCARRIGKRAGGGRWRPRSAFRSSCDFLRSAGLTSFDKTRFPLRPRHHARECGSAARRAGRRVRDICARRRARRAGGDSWRRSHGARRLISPRTAFWITDILSDPDAREYIFGRGGSLDFPFPVAAKTGTSEGYHDNWAIGYTRDVTVGVWVGNFDRSPLTNSSGVTGAGPIFHAVMLAAQKRVAGAADVMDKPLAVPTGDVTRDINLRAFRHARRRVVPGASRRMAAGRRRRVFHAAGTMPAKTASSWSGRRNTGSGRRCNQSIVHRRSSIVHRPTSRPSRRSTMDDGRSTKSTVSRSESARGGDLPDRSHAAIVLSDAGISRLRRSRRRPHRMDGERAHRWGHRTRTNRCQWPLSPASSVSSRLTTGAAVRKRQFSSGELSLVR